MAPGLLLRFFADVDWWKKLNVSAGSLPMLEISLHRRIL
jgi:hypothetical protein